MKTKMIVVVVLAAMCVLPLSAQVKVGVEGGMNLSHYLVSGSDGYKPHWHSYPDGWSLTVHSSHSPFPARLPKDWIPEDLPVLQQK